jgi:hypothetical protein
MAPVGSTNGQVFFAVMAMLIIWYSSQG